MIDAELNFMNEGYIPPPPLSPSQVDEPEPEKDFFVVVETMPELIGGLGSVQEKIRYPHLVVRANIQGRVYVQFIVNEQGGVENPVITRV